MKSVLVLPMCILSVLCLMAAARAENYLVHSADEIERLEGRLRPGDIVTMADGTWRDQHIVLKASGQAGRRILLRAQTPGKVVLTGTSRMSIGGDRLEVAGLLFRGVSLDSGSIFEFRGHSSPESRHCVLRDTAFIDCNPPDIDTRYFWVSLYGADNIVEQCYFSGQTHSGVTLCVWVDKGREARHVIRRNYFANRPQGNKNGFETLRIGTSKVSMTGTKCQVVENLFERCDGEIEIVSNKTCGNLFRANTFRQCSGCLTLRHGNRCIVEGNVFLGGDAKGAGGVRVIGEGHRVVDNYFSGTKGRAGGAISLQAGIPESPLSGYFQVRDCLIARNVFVDNPGTVFALDAGYGKRNCTLMPENVRIEDNTIVAPPDSASIVAANRPLSGILWRGNVAVGGDLGIEKPEGIALGKREAVQAIVPRGLSSHETGPMWMRNKPNEEETKP